MIKPGQHILSCAFGAGLTSAALLLKWGDRVTPLKQSDASLPPCEQTGIELVKRAVDYFCHRDKA